VAAWSAAVAVHACPVEQGPDRVFPADPPGAGGKEKRGSPRHSEGDGKNMSCSHASIVLPHINALIVRVFHSSVRHSTEGFPASVPENPGGAGALLEGGRSARISVAAHIPFHGLIEFVGSHANFALIAVFLLAL